MTSGNVLGKSRRFLCFRLLIQPRQRIQSVRRSPTNHADIFCGRKRKHILSLPGLGLTVNGSPKILILDRSISVLSNHRRGQFRNGSLFRKC